jgi:hypothetical protein
MDFRTNSSSLNEIAFLPVPGAPRDLLFLFTSRLGNSQGGGYRKLCHPSASLGMTKGRVVAFVRGRQIGWTDPILLTETL